MERYKKIVGKIQIENVKDGYFIHDEECFICGSLGINEDKVNDLISRSELYEKTVELFLELSKIYEELKEKQLSSGDGVENYTNGYRYGHINGQIELLEKILNIDTGLRSESEKG